MGKDYLKEICGYGCCEECVGGEEMREGGLGGGGVEERAGVHSI